MKKLLFLLLVLPLILSACNNFHSDENENLNLVFKEEERWFPNITSDELICALKNIPEDGLEITPTEYNKLMSIVNDFGFTLDGIVVNAKKDEWFNVYYADFVVKNQLIPICIKDYFWNQTDVTTKEPLKIGFVLSELFEPYMYVSLQEVDQKMAESENQITQQSDTSINDITIFDIINILGENLKMGGFFEVSSSINGDYNFGNISAKQFEDLRKWTFSKYKMRGVVQNTHELVRRAWNEKTGAYDGEFQLFLVADLVYDGDIVSIELPCKRFYFEEHERFYDGEYIEIIGVSTGEIHEGVGVLSNIVISDRGDNVRSKLEEQLT